MQKQIVQLWKELLGIQEVYLEDNFFQLGGHSLMAVRMIYAIEKQLGVKVSIQKIFELQTIQSLAEFIESHKTSSSQDAIVPLTDRFAPARLSFAQQRLWFLYLYESDKTVYNIPLALRFKGQLNQILLRQALEALVNRHESLRTTFETAEDGSPRQRVHDSIPLPWTFEDLSTLPAASQTAQLESICQQQARQVFNLECGPLIHFHLIGLGPDECVLTITMHHIISDGWSISVLLEELATLYKTFVANKPSPLVPLSIHYTDYAAWQLDQFTRPDYLKDQIQYWTQLHAGQHQDAELPTDFPRPASQTFEGGCLQQALSESIRSQVQAFARQHHTTSFVVYLTVLKILLARYTGQSNICIGIPATNRSRKECESILGFFVNTLAIRTDLSRCQSFRDALKQVHDSVSAGFANADYPFDRLIDHLQLERQTGKTPLFQILFTHQSPFAAVDNLPDLQMTIEPIYNGTSKFDLSLFVEETDRDIVVSAEYNTALYKPETITRILTHYEHLLSCALHTPEVSLCQISLLTEPEQQQLAEWNNTHKDYPKDKCIHQLFEQQAAKTPDAVALVFEEQTLNYQQLNARANQLAHYLMAHGVGSDVPVGVCMDRSFELMVALLGILKAGGVYVPLDPAYPTERLNHMIRETGMTVILTRQRFQILDFGQSSHIVAVDSKWKQICAASPLTNPEVSIRLQHATYILFTSGSTGTPKGVVVEHGAILNSFLWLQETFALGSQDRVLQKTTFTFDVSLWDMLWPLLFGARVVLASPEKHIDMDYLVEMIRSHQITVINFVPSVLDLFLSHPRVSQCTSLRLVLAAGEALSYSLQTRFFELLKAELHNLYGPTETIQVTWWACRKDSPYPMVPIGKPIANTQAYILDHALQPVPIGVPGELYIGGVQLARGYLARPELTEERFIRNPFNPDPNSRLYKTGDICRWLEDGNIDYLGRADDQVKIRGFRIELGEIETALRSHPGVAQAAVAIHENQPGQKTLLGYIVCTQKQAVTANDILAYLRQRLPDYMIPAGIMELDQIPLTASGKTNRKALPTMKTVQSHRPLRLPETKLHRQLAEIWKDLLQIPQVGIDDNFFHLGGHSLLAARLFYYLEKCFQISLPLGLIFEAPTLGQLAAHLQNQRHDVMSKAVVQIKPGRLKQGIFYLPGVGGHTLNFYHLAHYLNIPLSQYGLNLPGLDGKQKPMETIEQMASFFIREIQQIQPEGPYWLCGFSMGGRIAYEMALQLTKQGHNVAFLGILGTSAPGFPKAYLWKPAHYLERFWKFCGLSLDEKMRYLQSQRQYKKLRKQRQTAQKDGWDIHEFPNYRKLYQAGLEAFIRYQTQQPYDGDIVLFREMKDFNLLDKDMYSNPTFGWDKVVTGAIRVHDIDCSHPHILHQPHVEVCATLLEKEILEALRLHKMIYPTGMVNPREKEANGECHCT
ncbi:MAG: amino acid adenylation domain-containing protein [Anaerohalosphaeraceae bacterium]